MIPSAQFNQALSLLADIGEDLLDHHPILRYRVDNLRRQRHVRGIASGERWRCRLALDDMAVVQGKHYPCIIYLREGGGPVGEVGPDMRRERADWVEQHEPWTDPICKANCLDVCVDYNRKAAFYNTP